MKDDYGTCFRCNHWKQKKITEFGNCKILKEQTQSDEFCNDFEVKVQIADGLEFDKNSDVVKK
jgi:hypothetical protein